MVVTVMVMVVVVVVVVGIMTMVIMVVVLMQAAHRALPFLVTPLCCTESRACPKHQRHETS